MTRQMLLPMLFATALAAAAQAQITLPDLRHAANPAPRDRALKPVFEQFGGRAGLVALVNDFMANLMADPRTHPFFAGVNREHIKAELVDQFCVILDGPCTYTGANMKRIHYGLDVRRGDFNALVEDLQKAMVKHGIPFRAQNKLLAKLAPMHREIVTK